MADKTELMKASLSEQIYDTLLKRIVRSEIEQGARINMDSLREEFSVSIAPIREALQRLAQENLVIIKPRIGFFSNKLTIKDIDDLFNARKVLESYALKNIINTDLEEKLLSIKKNMLQISTANTKVRAHVSQNSCDDFENLEIAFHECLLINSCDNTYIKNFYNSLSNVSSIIRHLVMRIGDDYKEHIAIIDAMLEKDCKKAEKALSIHLTNVGKATIDFIKESQSE